MFSDKVLRFVFKTKLIAVLLCGSFAVLIVRFTYINGYDKTQGYTRDGVEIMVRSRRLGSGVPPHLPLSQPIPTLAPISFVTEGLAPGEVDGGKLRAARSQRSDAGVTESDTGYH